MEEVQARHRKELKTLEGEHRAAVKKTKASKGKKAKEDVSALQEEYTKQLEEMKQRHVEELAIYTTQPKEEEDEMIESVVETNKDDDDDVKKEMKERKQNKARRKREQERLKQKQLEAEQERDLAGPSARKEELAQIQLTLQPLGLEIIPVVSDGHCLYRAVANQVENKDYRELRQLCATTLERYEEDFSPFCEYTEDIPSFAMYVDRIRNSADWGGHVELRALSLALKRPILVYSQSQSHPLEIHCETNHEEQTEPIRLSYHLHYYSLGEHYNCVMPKSNNKNNDHDDDDNNKNDHDETV